MSVICKLSKWFPKINNTKATSKMSTTGIFRTLPNINDGAFLAKKLYHGCLRGLWICFRQASINHSKHSWFLKCNFQSILIKCLWLDPKLTMLCFEWTIWCLILKIYLKNIHLYTKKYSCRAGLTLLCIKWVPGDPSDHF